MLCLSECHFRQILKSHFVSGKTWLNYNSFGNLSSGFGKTFHTRMCFWGRIFCSSLQFYDAVIEAERIFSLNNLSTYTHYLVNCQTLLAEVISQFVIPAHTISQTLPDPRWRYTRTEESILT